MTAEAEFSINFSEQENKFCIKAKDSEINSAPLCLGNVSKDLSVDNMKKIGLYEYIHNFSVEFDNSDVEDI